MPVYRQAGEAHKKPTFLEIMKELYDCTAFWKNRKRLLPACNLIFHFVTFLIFVVFFLFYFTWLRFLVLSGVCIFLAYFNNTVWYHRYCSHRAFQFRNMFWASLFLWTNPAFFREESYVTAHYVHHARSDQFDDPHGPHIGWLGNFFSFESQQKLNTNISPKSFEILSKRLKHIGFPLNSFHEFQRTGEFEKIYHYSARVIFAQLLWGTVAYFIAGFPGIFVWYSCIFAYTFIIRDFNFRGHYQLFKSEFLPMNHLFYGFFAGEWHKNHHEKPRAVRTGRKWWQIDIPYYMVRVMSFMGIISYFIET